MCCCDWVLRVNGKLQQTILLIALIGGVLAPLAQGGGKKEVARMSFHIETEASDNPKMIFPHTIFGQQRYFRRIPDISSADFVAFSPFPAEDQMSYGAIFQLKGNAARRLAAVTSINIGRWFVCQAFGRIVDGVLIDEPINDGRVVIWRGLALAEIGELDKSIPRFGEGKPRGK